MALQRGVCRVVTFRDGRGCRGCRRVGCGLALAVGLLLRRRVSAGNDRAGLEAVTRELSWWQRWRVTRAVARGRAVRDPALVPAVVARARYMQFFCGRFTGRGWRWAFFGFAVFQLMLAVFRLMEGGPWTVWRVCMVASPVVLAVLLEACRGSIGTMRGGRRGRSD